MPDEVITKAELARRIGVDRSQAVRWENAGMPTLADGKVKANAAEAWVRRHIDSTNRNRRHARLDSHARGAAELAERQEAFDTMARLGLWLLAQRTPDMVAEAALAVGVPLPQAQALHDVLLTRMAELADDTRGAWMGLPPGELGPFKRMEHLPAPDWPTLQQAASVTLNAPPTKV